MSDQPSNSPEPTMLTAEGRRLLVERRQVLEQRLEEIREVSIGRDLPAELAEEQFRAGHELDSITELLSEAVDAEEVSDDPLVVELGDSVAIRLENGTEERYVIVHPVEATVDDVRISAESPLGSALMGRRVGESIDVVAPAGSYRCTIVSAERELDAS